MNVLDSDNQAQIVANITAYAHEASLAWIDAAHERSAPCVIFKPQLSLDGNKWCALFGDDLQNGVAGFGDSPAEAMRAFNSAWYQKVSP